MAKAVTSNFNVLWTMLKWCLPLYLVLLPLVAIFGYFQPWQSASATLNSYVGQTPIMVGFSYHSQNNKRISSRTYILFPLVLSEPKIVTIQQINGSNPTASVSLAGFLLFIGWLLLSFIGTWWFWLRGTSESHLTPHSSRTG